MIGRYITVDLAAGSSSGIKAANKTALNAAIALLNAGPGGCLLLPPGVYYTDGDLTTLSAASIVRGMGAFSSQTSGTTLVVTSGTLFTATKPVWYEHFLIGGGTTAIRFSGVNGGGLRGMYLDAQAISVDIEDSNSYHIGTGSSIVNSTSDAVRITASGAGDGGDATIHGLTIVTASGNGLTWQGGGGLKFIGNKIMGANSGSSAAIALNPAKGIRTGDLLFEGNSIEGAHNYGFVMSAPTMTISGITRSGSTATVTTSSNHGLSDGFLVVVYGANQTEYNGWWIITVTAANQFTYTVSGTPATPATGSMWCESGAISNLQFIGNQMSGSFPVRLFYSHSGIHSNLLCCANTFGSSVANSPLLDLNAISGATIGDNEFNGGGGGSCTAIQIAAGCDRVLVGVQRDGTGIDKLLANASTTTRVKGFLDTSFANIPSVMADGSLMWCTNGTVGNPLAGAGGGCIAKRVGGAWIGI